MSLTKIKDAAVRVIRELPNRPTGTGHMSAATLKAAFDQAAENIKTAVNRMADQLESSGGAAEIGFHRTTEVPADNVQEAVERVQAQLQGVSQGAVANGSITTEKMADGAVTLEKLGASAMGFRDVSGQMAARSDAVDWVDFHFYYSPLLRVLYFTGETAGISVSDAYFEIRVSGPYVPAENTAVAVHTYGAAATARFDAMANGGIIGVTISGKMNATATVMVSGRCICREVT